jgi:2-C-methyl-D-erythritol 4-phosphate cytidylyltransferase
VPVAGRPLVDWSIEALRAAAPVVRIVVACPPGEAGRLAQRDVAVVEGGATRSASVSNALATVDTELVAIHDAARPLLTPRLVEDLVAVLAADPGAAGAIAATPVTDTIKEASGGEGERLPAVERTLDRARLWAAQTPQVFRVGALLDALAASQGWEQPATDEAMVVEAAGRRVLVHPAPAENIKVTTPLDLRLAELLLSERSAAQ